MTLPRPVDPAWPVLLVEDDPALRRLLSCGLEMAGFVVEEDDGQSDPAAVAAGGPYRLVVTDLQLGPRTAVELLVHLRRAQPEVPVLCATGYADLGPELRGAVPDVALLRKPFDLEQFGGAINALVDRS